MLDQQTTLNCRGKLLDLSTPIVMGVLNITPDSFYDGGQYNTDQKVMKQAEKMIREGVSIIDIGGVSTRPGAIVVNTQQEIERISPIIRLLKKEFPETVLSIDTYNSETAKAGVGLGAGMVNDISAGRFDQNLFAEVAKLDVPYVLMHMQGKPQNMQNAPSYNNVIEEIVDFMILKVGELRKEGVKDVIIDPGFGFGKTVEHNFILLKNLQAFKILGLPILAGVSRKSMICKVLKIKPDAALNGTTALHMVALQQGAKILRVHDVKEAVETIKLWQQLQAV